jgi:hypothetical protein
MQIKESKMVFEANGGDDDMKYNSEIHHRRSIRLPGYDYGQAGLYFITVCAWQRQCIFGAILLMETLCDRGWGDAPKSFG